MKRYVLLLVASLVSLPGLALAQPSYLNFETGQVRPAVMSVDATRLFVVNTPDDRLEIFDLSGSAPAWLASVPVGLSPVAVAVESAERVWVVNHLSDSVSIVDVAASPPRVVRTLLVGDEPNDIVFAGSPTRRAFITTAHRGQNHPTPRGDYAVPGIGRANVWVFDPGDLGAALGGAPVSILQLFGDKPRALTVSPDGSKVYAAVFHSGNRTMALNEGHVCDGGPTASCSTGPGGLPAPVTNYLGVPGPEVGLIVRYDDALGYWKDELDRNWNDAVRFNLPDRDVFEIDANQSPPVATCASYAGVGTILFNMVTNPVSGTIYVSNTEARNEVRFEGMGTYVRELGLREGKPASVRGHLHEARITVIDDGVVTPRHLNPHIPYDTLQMPPGTRDRSIAQPLEMVVTSDGSTLFVAGYGSSAVGVIDTQELESGSIGTSTSRLIPLSDGGPVGPSGLVLDEVRGRLYVVTRFDNSLVTVDVSSRSVVGVARMHTPEPEHTIVGRPMLYDAYFTSSNGEASCGSCHVFGDMDDLAWDLGDPDHEVEPNPNEFGPGGALGLPQVFHPLKGPMTTQTLRGMADHGPMHWRGDRTGGNATPPGDPMDEIAAFVAFNGAFAGLVGRDEGVLRDEEMLRFAEFAVDIHYPPNPIRQLDNSLRADEQAGHDLYFGAITDTLANCEGCHRVDRNEGFFGSGGQNTFENESQHFKVAQLRNAYQKVGMFGMAPGNFFFASDASHQGDQIRGFGYLHDGSTDTLFRFLHATVFNVNSTERRNLEALIMAFDTILAPIVGQQITLASTTDDEAMARIDLMMARATASSTWPGGLVTKECELVVHGIVDEVPRGWLFDGVDAFVPDDADETPLTDAALRAMADTTPLTYTCAPPGSGRRMALDRDEDDVLNQNDPDPASRPFIAIPNPSIPPLPPPDEEPDGGMEKSNSKGCDCSTAGATSDALFLALLVVAFTMHRMRRRRSATVAR
jgi:MYXO-CTERM domain-containing protein